MDHTFKVVLNVMKTALWHVNLEECRCIGSVSKFNESGQHKNTLSCECARGISPEVFYVTLSKANDKRLVWLRSKRVQSVHLERSSIASDF